MSLINKQKYSECQLISAFNAAIYLGTRKYIKNKEYEELVDLTMGRYGSCISVSKSYPILGIDYKDVTPTKKTFIKWTSNGFPVQVNVWHEKTGFHTVLMVDYNENKDRVKVINFRHITNRRMWVSWDVLYSLLSFSKNVDPTKGKFRVFMRK